MSQNDPRYQSARSAREQRVSTESAGHDAEEHQTLLADSQQYQGTHEHGEYIQRAEGYSPPPARRSRRRKRAGREVMHEIEEGGPGSRASSSSSESSEIGGEKLGTALPDRKTRRRRSICGLTLVNAFILGLFVAIAYGAYHASQQTKHTHDSNTHWTSNGSAQFAPTTILLSLDGFRADFLTRNLTPTLNSFIREGVSPEYMTPSFPSLTFPNHYTLVTGLHPESHGIVANSFWDETFGETFTYTDRAHSMQPKWWYPHPLWATAEAAGVRTAIHMWPGSEAHIGDVQPLHVDVYNGSETLARKTERVLSWLDKPGPRDPGFVAQDARPQLVAAYVPDVDADGHKYGPNSTEVDATLRRVDEMLASLFAGLRARNLTDVVNVVVVSDHGMASTARTRLVQFEDLVDPALVAHIDGWPHYGLRPKDPRDLGRMYARLKAAAGVREGFEVYLREDVPARYHFQAHYRIAPLWIFAKTGWAIVTKDEFDVAKGVGADGDQVYHPRGIHGYDNEDALMRAIFVARGPAFPHQRGSRVAPFQNTEVYNIVCDTLGIEPMPNNGTLRLPLKPNGVHGDEHDEAGPSTTSVAPILSTEEIPLPTNAPSPPAASANPGDDQFGDAPTTRPKKPGFWAYLQWLRQKLKDRLKATIGWVKGSFRKPRPGDSDGEHDGANANANAR